MWIATGDIRQYIPYSDKQLFIGENLGALRIILDSISNELKVEIADIEEKIGVRKSLKTAVLRIKDILEFLKVYKNVEHLRGFQPNIALDITEPEFEVGLQLLTIKQQIDRDHQQTLKEWEQARDVLTEYKNFIKTINTIEERLKNKLSENGDILQVIFKLFPKMEIRDEMIHNQIQYYQILFDKPQSTENRINITVSENIQKVKSFDFKKKIEEYENACKERDNTFKEARLILGKEPDITKWQISRLATPAEEEREFAVAKGIYEKRFEEIIKEHAEGDAYKFGSNFNFIELCSTILPEAFLSEEAQEENFITLIEQYFSQINEKNKSLNTRKLQKIREILDEVDDEIEKRLDTVRQIHNFLNSKEHEITGGHRVSLRSDTAGSYPKAWIKLYIDKMEQEGTLFAIGETLNELLKDSVSLEEKMIGAFHAFGGHKSIKPKIEDLLNPNSYFDLNFKMESHVTGKTNSGSTGQTYAATALLCIARLSLVNKGSFNKFIPEGIRFMPIDEAEGLGSNFDMLYEIARTFDYQILTMSINPLGKFKEGEQYIYILSNNKEVSDEVKHPPFGIFCENDQIYSSL